jgi:hypothetical protein
VVLDCEAVAYDRVANKILPFQVTDARYKCMWSIVLPSSWSRGNNRICAEHDVLSHCHPSTCQHVNVGSAQAALLGASNTMLCCDMLSTRKRKDVKVEDVQVKARFVHKPPSFTP